MKAVESMLRQLRLVGPYVAVGLLVPGGSIVALVLWVYRSKTAARPAATGSPAQIGALPSSRIGHS